MAYRPNGVKRENTEHKIRQPTSEPLTKLTYNYNHHPC